MRRVVRAHPFTPVRWTITTSIHVTQKNVPKNQEQAALLVWIALMWIKRNMPRNVRTIFFGVTPGVSHLT